MQKEQDLLHPSDILRYAVLFKLKCSLSNSLYFFEDTAVLLGDIFFPAAVRISGVSKKYRGNQEKQRQYDFFYGFNIHFRLLYIIIC